MRKFIKVDRDLTGQKNNLLTAKNKIEKNGRWYWNCECECGGNTCIREDFFISGKTKSCGCYGSRNSIYKINRKAPGESALNSLFNSYKGSAKKRNHEFHLTIDQFKTLVSQNCHYCEAPPRDSIFNKRAYGDFKSNGIDRKFSSIGYLIENCLPCCSSCNLMKGTLDYHDFIARCGVIYLIRKIK